MLSTPVDERGRTVHRDDFQVSWNQCRTSGPSSISLCKTCNPYTYNVRHPLHTTLDLNNSATPRVGVTLIWLISHDQVRNNF